jgi:hypothetical protein
MEATRMTVYDEDYENRLSEPLVVAGTVIGAAIVLTVGAILIANIVASRPETI